MKKLSIIFLIIIALNLSSCCNCNNEKNMIKGYITVIGNEPFTKLAIVTNDDKVYQLECNENLKNELWKNQGNNYLIKFDKIKNIDGKIIIDVESAILLQNKLK